MSTSSKKIALITGGSRGLGRNTVLSLAKRGIDSILTYQSNRAEAEKVVRLVAEAGGQAVALPLDTGKVSTFDAFVQAVRKALAGLGAEHFDYLVNNAGTSHHAAFDKTTEAELDGLYNVHFKGVFFLTQKLLPLINDGGRIVMISSGLTRIIYPGSAAYASMKGAIEVLISGGMIRDNPEFNKRVADMTALGRAGLPDDVGPMIASLLSEDHRWVNAQRIEVSGGMSI
jgi:NAD(P)-dependent dehydrogenase (short-subunit alcohol dehydrogenase family)